MNTINSKDSEKAKWGLVPSFPLWEKCVVSTVEILETYIRPYKSAVKVCNWEKHAVNMELLNKL